MLPTRPTTTGSVAVGDLVISWHHDNPVRYGGVNDDAQFSTTTFGGGTPVIRCEPQQVAPARIPIPRQDARLSIERRPRLEMPYGERGQWRLVLPGAEFPVWCATKREATATGLRRLAILDWHAGKVLGGPVMLPHTGMKVPHGRIALRKVKSMPTRDGVAYTAELMVDGQPVGTITNTGRGGPTTWLPHDREVFDWADMTWFAEQCRDENGEPLHEEFVLALLYDEDQVARQVARDDRDERHSVRTKMSVGGVLYEDQHYGVPREHVAEAEQLADYMWRQRPDVQVIEWWTGSAWQALPRPAGQDPAGEPEHGKGR